ncbi:MAG: bifunctional (p)ppGpp synthetase/guanosine-3',5'-bis(diphosphate) 3'-pyrophosphohydrolase [Anaeromyxobacteraceae bacterium]|nr:bifunctional (p)ppGpp synthetase/guanosine-3',5'-bis(diphosphate) 3'-pyrophosphohydrolase [Anaeromyxobacteraceae bacterium]
MLRLNDILDRVATYHPDPDLDLIKKAYVYSAKVHQGQLRKSGEPYLVHPLEVAGILAEMKLDEASVVTGLLHDTIEDTLATKDEVGELFGPEIADLVDGVTKLSQFSAANTQEEKQAENFRKMVVAMAKDIRVLLVKLADRTHNMRTLDHMKPESQERIARETLDIYAPLANRLGIQWVKAELEELSFKYLKPDDFADITGRIAAQGKEKQRFVEDVVAVIREKLAGQGLEADVSGRLKHAYSVFRKMRQLDVDFDQIQDVIGFRVLVDSVAQCYESLGVIHSVWKPVPGRFKDYIAIPKPNGYQSLHTTVVGPRGERIEVQIRTREMHRIAEEGVAAHWAYKEQGRDGKGGGALSKKDAAEFGWLRQLVEFQREVDDPREFLETVKVDLFSDEVFVFTPKGDIKALPRGSTPVDFAYAIHTQIGQHCVGGKVNGKLVPLRHKLKNGDSVEILQSPHAHPSKDWLTFVKTSRAQARIRQYLRVEEHRRSMEIGRELAEKDLRKYGLSLGRVEKSGDLAKAGEKLGHRTPEEVLAALGYGKLTTAQLLAHLLPQEQLTAPPPAAAPPSRLSELFRKVASRSSSSGVRVSGVEDMLVRYGKCCNPVPGDRIVGFITRGRGVTVHTAGCDKVLESSAERRVDVTWDVKGDFKRPVALRVVGTDRPGLLAKISKAFGEADVNISQATVKTTGDKAVFDLEVTIGDLKQLNGIMKSIERIDGVQTINRV